MWSRVFGANFFSLFFENQRNTTSKPQSLYRKMLPSVMKVEYFSFRNNPVFVNTARNFNHDFKKVIKSTSTFGPPCFVHFENTKNVLHILSTTISN